MTTRFKKGDCFNVIQKGIKHLFQNLETAEKKMVEWNLVTYWCEIEDKRMYQLVSEDQTYWMDDADNQMDAITNGCWDTRPEKVWGWKDIKRIGAIV